MTEDSEEQQIEDSVGSDASFWRISASGSMASSLCLLEGSDTISPGPARFLTSVAVAFFAEATILDAIENNNKWLRSQVGWFVIPIVLNGKFVGK